MLTMLSALLTRQDACTVAELIASSIANQEVIHLDVDSEDSPIASIFFGEEKDVAIGKTVTGKIIVVSLGETMKRSTRKGTVAIINP